MADYQQLAKGPSAPPAPVDASRYTESKEEKVGDTNHAAQAYEFDTGLVELIRADDSMLYDARLNTATGLDSTCAKYPVAAACYLVPFLGWCYNANKTNIIKQDEIGIVTQVDGGVHLLTPGCHYSGCLTTIRRFKVKDNRINHGNMHIIRITSDSWGLAWRNGVPQLLAPGRHVVNDPLFEFEGPVSMTVDMIKHGTIHIITIPAGKVGLCTVQGVGHILECGRHFFNNPNFEWKGTVDRSSECISIGSKARIVVPSGRLGMAWDKGDPLVLEHGKVIEIDSPYFEYKGSVDMTQDVIVHGSLKFIQVCQGKFGVSYDEGALTILPPGRHTLEKPTHFFAGFLPSGQQCLNIEAVTSMTADNVGIRFDSALTIQVVDAEKAVSMLGIAVGEGKQQGGGVNSLFNDKEFFWNIIQQAKLALSIIIGNNKLNASFRATNKAGTIPDAVEAKEQAAAEDGADEGSSFKQHVHDIFLETFTHNMLETCGVQVVDMSIEDITITNIELAKAMSQAAVAMTHLDSARIELEVNRTQAESEQIADVTRAEGRANAMRIIAAAEADRIGTLDQAMKATSSVTQQRELIRATGDAISESKSTLLLGRSIVDVSRILGAQAIADSGD